MCMKFRSGGEKYEASEIAGDGFSILRLQDLHKADKAVKTIGQSRQNGFVRKSTAYSLRYVHTDQQVLSHLLPR